MLYRKNHTGIPAGFLYGKRPVVFRLCGFHLRLRVLPVMTKIGDGPGQDKDNPEQEQRQGGMGRDKNQHQNSSYQHIEIYAFDRNQILEAELFEGTDHQEGLYV